MIHLICVPIPGTSTLISGPIDSLIEIKAPSNYKDPDKIAEYIFQKKVSVQQELSENVVENLHLLDCAFEVRKYCNENTETFTVSSVEDLLKFVIKQNEEVCIVAVGAVNIVRALRVAALTSKSLEGKYLKHNIIYVDPKSYVISSSNYNTITDNARDLLGLTPHALFSVEGMIRFLDMFSEVLHSGDSSD